MISLRDAMIDLRHKLNMSMFEFAERTGLSYSDIRDVEQLEGLVDELLIDRIESRLGIDLHVYATSFHGDSSKLPERMRKPADELAEMWREEIEQRIAAIKGGGTPVEQMTEEQKRKLELAVRGGTWEGSCE